MKINYKLTILSSLTIITWSVIFYFILISHFKYSPLHLSKKISKEIFFATPQGWSFFTKDPRYDRLEIYQVINNSTLEQVTRPNFSIENFYGFKRQNRQFLNEAFSSIKNVVLNDSIWYNSSEGVDKAYQDINSIYNFKNTFKNPVLCGQFVFEMYKPIPWAWSSNKSYKNPKKYLIINLQCK